MKYSGKIGYGIAGEIRPGVWMPNNITERDAIGDFTRNIHKADSSDRVNDVVTVSNVISIVSDPYAMENFRHIKYATLDGVKWKVISVEVQYPRLILTLGGEYNENDA